MVNVLVTGGSGMVGQSIKTLILHNEEYIDYNFHFISSSDYDLRDIIQVENCFKERKYDEIIHLAAIVGGLYKNIKHNLEMLLDNLKINMNILEMCNKYNVNRGIFCLSSCIYPKFSSIFPMNEEYICEGSPHESNEGYAYAKRMLYIMCKHYNKQFNREYICVSPVNLYGPSDNFSIQDGHVIPSLINRMYKTKHNIYPYVNDTFEVFGTGIAQRQFLFVNDFSRIILNILKRKAIKNGLYNICNDKEYKINEVIRIISKLLDFNYENVYFNDNYSDGILKKTVSNEKLRDIMPGYVFTDLNEGLTTTVNWFLENANNIRE